MPSPSLPGTPFWHGAISPRKYYLLSPEPAAGQPDHVARALGPGFRLSSQAPIAPRIGQALLHILLAIVPSLNVPELAHSSSYLRRAGSRRCCYGRGHSGMNRGKGIDGSPQHARFACCRTRVDELRQTARHRTSYELHEATSKLPGMTSLPERPWLRS